MHSNPERGGVVGTVFLLLGILVLIAMVAVVAGGLYIAHNIRVNAERGRHGEAVSLETPFGSMRVREDSKLDPKQFGVPVYPGAVLREDHHKLASIELNFGSENKELAVVAGEYTTSDPVEKVREFYRGELPHWMVREDHHGAVHFSFTEGGQKKIVAISRRGGLTHIGLAFVGEPGAN